jgi:hypothetical protein
MERLEILGALPPGSILAHGVHLAGDQVQRCEALGCWLVHNPRSNEGNRVGYARALGRSHRVALGCDGWDADMQAEEAALARLAALHGDEAARRRLANGQVLVAERFGSHPDPLHAGALGDVVVRESGAVRHVVVGGRVVVQDGALRTGDLAGITAMAQEQATRLWQAMSGI